MDRNTMTPAMEARRIGLRPTRSISSKPKPEREKRYYKIVICSNNIAAMEASRIAPGLRRERGR